MGTKLLIGRKDLKRSWPDHYLYLFAVSDATGGAEALVLDNVVQYAGTDLRQVLMCTEYANNRTDYLRHAQELAHFAQAIEIDLGGARVTGKKVVLHILGICIRDVRLGRAKTVTKLDISRRSAVVRTAREVDMAMDVAYI